jgi:hypothetical protein
MPFGNAVGQGFVNPEINEISIVVLGPDDGLFFYDPTEGTGNLVGSISFFAGFSGTDQFGNTVYPGFVSYMSNGGYTQLNNGILSFVGAAGVFQGASISASNVGGFLNFFSGLVSSGDQGASMALESGDGSGIGEPVLSLSALVQGLEADTFVLNGQAITVPQGPTPGVAGAPGAYTSPWGNSVVNAINYIFAVLQDSEIVT